MRPQFCSRKIWTLQCLEATTCVASSDYVMFGATSNMASSDPAIRRVATSFFLSDTSLDASMENDELLAELERNGTVSDPAAFEEASLDISIQAADVYPSDPLLQPQTRNLADMEATIPSMESPSLTKNLSMAGDPSPSFAVPVANRGRLFARHRSVTGRLIRKTGDSNVNIINVTNRKRKYAIDLITTIMEMKWRYHVVLFMATFILSWLIFGVLWYALAFVNGDLNQDGGDDDSTSGSECVVNVFDLQSAVLFSLESQMTIGYGYRMIGSGCPLGTVLLMFQMCFGVFITCFLTGIVFGKLSRPKKRAQARECCC